MTKYVEPIRYPAPPVDEADVDDMTNQTQMRVQMDWVGRVRSCVLAWGLPTTVLILSIFVDPPAKTLLWSASLTWMGIACLANADRCGRMHCYFTGPFFLLMALASLLHGFEILWLGSHGWLWLGLAIGAGSCLLWYIPEYFWGKYVEFKQPS